MESGAVNRRGPLSRIGERPDRQRASARRGAPDSIRGYVPTPLPGLKPRPVCGRLPSVRIPFSPEWIPMRTRLIPFGLALAAALTGSCALLDQRLPPVPLPTREAVDRVVISLPSSDSFHPNEV